MVVAGVAVAGVAEVVGTIGGGRDGRDQGILVEGGKGPPWSLRYM